MPIGITAKLAIIAISGDRRLIICKLIDHKYIEDHGCKVTHF